MKLKILFSAILITTLAIILFSLYLFIDGPNRYDGFRFIAESQHLIFEKKLSRSLAQQDFLNASNLLKDRIDSIRDVSTKNNTATLNYFKELKFAFESAVTSKERLMFLDLLKDLEFNYPNNYKLKIMLAKTLSIQSPDLAMNLIDQAIFLIGSLSEAYKLGIEISLATNNFNKLQDYCLAYQTNHFGGKRFIDMDANQTQELNLRRIGLDIRNEHLFLENNNLQLGQKHWYEFTLPKPIVLDQDFSLILPTVSGVMVDISTIKLFSKGQKVKSISQDEFILSSDESYFDEQGELLLSGRGKPEVVDFIFIKNFKDIEVDKLEFAIKFSRQKLFSRPVCPSQNP